MPNWLQSPLRRLKRSLVTSSSGSISQNLLGDRDIEWSWIAAQLPEGTGNVLDFGNGGSYLSLIAAQKGYQAVAVDLEPVSWYYQHKNLSFMQGDVLKLDLPSAHFDVIINCSTVEHVGLTGRYGISVALDEGDLLAMKRLRDLLTPQGTMLLTIPVGQDAVFSPACRIYGQNRLPQLLKGFNIQKEVYWVKNNENKWIQTDKNTALAFVAHAGEFSALKDCYALGCFVLSKSSS